MQLTRKMVREEEVTPEEGVVCILAEDKNGNVIPTGRYMRQLAGRIIMTDTPGRMKKRTPYDEKGSAYSLGDLKIKS